MKPAFEIPKFKLIDTEKLMGKYKNLQTQLPPCTGGKMPLRKDLNPKWDESF